MMRFYNRLDYKISLILVMAMLTSFSFAIWLYLRSSLIYYQPIETSQAQQLQKIIQTFSVLEQTANKAQLLTEFQQQARLVTQQYPQHISILIDDSYQLVSDSSPENIMVELVRPEAQAGFYAATISAIWEKADIITIYVNVPGRVINPGLNQTFHLLVVPKTKQPPLSISTTTLLSQLLEHLWRFGWLYVLMVLLAVRIIYTSISPLRRLEKVANALSADQIPPQVEATGSNEVGKIISAFNLASEKLAINKQQREQMIGDIAHELRTPITNILGRIEAFQDGIISDKDAVINFTAQQLTSLMNIVEDMQLLNNADSNQLTIQQQSILLSQYLQDWLQPHQQDPDIQLKLTHANPALEHKLALDPLRLNQVLDNLLSNAKRAQPIKLCIHIKLEQAETTTRIIFSDNGPGVPKAHLPHLFDRLYRVDPSRNNQTGGSGLGLSIVKSLIEAQGGNVKAYNQTDAGLAIEFTFPVKN